MKGKLITRNFINSSNSWIQDFRHRWLLQKLKKVDKSSKHRIRRKWNVNYINCVMIMSPKGNTGGDINTFYTFFVKLNQKKETEVSKWHHVIWQKHFNWKTLIFPWKTGYWVICTFYSCNWRMILLMLLSERHSPCP